MNIIEFLQTTIDQCLASLPDVDWSSQHHPRKHLSPMHATINLLDYGDLTKTLVRAGSSMADTEDEDEDMESRSSRRPSVSLVDLHAPASVPSANSGTGSDIKTPASDGVPTSEEVKVANEDMTLADVLPSLSSMASTRRLSPYVSSFPAF